MKFLGFAFKKQRSLGDVRRAPQHAGQGSRIGFGAYGLSRIAVPGVMFFAIMLNGCEAKKPPAAEHAAPTSVALPTDRQPTADEAVASDPCSNRLHDIEGALLLYYAVNKRMPLVLDEIKAFADAGVQLDLMCPVSKQPYIYSSQGLVASGYGKRMVVWDSTPAHHGSRWCIVMPRLQPNVALVPEVLLVPEKAFAAFVPPIN